LVCGPDEIRPDSQWAEWIPLQLCSESSFNSGQWWSARHLPTLPYMYLSLHDYYSLLVVIQPNTLGPGRKGGQERGPTAAIPDTVTQLATGAGVDLGAGKEKLPAMFRDTTRASFRHQAPCFAALQLWKTRTNGYRDVSCSAGLQCRVARAHSVVCFCMGIFVANIYSAR
jgi:hypothetical protein